MRLATFLLENTESWGFVIADPVSGEERIVEPTRVPAVLERTILSTSGYAHSRPEFRDDWPADLAGALASGDDGLSELARLARFLERYLAQSDAAVLDLVSHRVADVELLAPIPRPRLCWGLVTNAPSFVRNKVGIDHLNLFPLGHQRPQGSVIGSGAPVIMRGGHHVPLMSYNVELGVVIGRGGRYIALEDAMDHVAGFTTVTDVAGTYYYGVVPGNEGRGYHLPPEYDDWLYQATASWGGKIADSLCPVGPYLVTKDEVGDPYDLLVYTRQNGRQRDRAHTSAMMLGIERVIHWYSSFATLHPGDVIHFGTMGVDGLPIPSEQLERNPTVLESEIEDVGLLRNPVRVIEPHEPVPFESHPSYAVRRAAQEPPLTASEWSVEQARHVYTAFGNHEQAAGEGLPRLAVPRFLNGPASSLGASGTPVELPVRATELEVAIELAVVIRRLTSGTARGGAKDAMLSLSPLVSLCDLSFADTVIEPARAGERHIPAVYGRWADGFNVLPSVVGGEVGEWRERRMALTVGDEEVSASTSDYLFGPEDLIEAISAQSTLFPGDVVTLGSTTARVRVTAETPVRVAAAIDGLGAIAFDIVPASH